MRVFIGTTNVTDAPMLLQKGFQELGILADTGLLSQNHFYTKSYTTNIDIYALHNQTSCFSQRSGKFSVRAPKEFRVIANKYDLFIFIASHSLLPRLTDLSSLEMMGKNVICYQTGSELRHECTSIKFWQAYGHTFPQQAYQYTKTSKPIYELSAYQHSFINKLYNARMTERHSTTICATPPINSFGMRPYMSIQLPFDQKLCKFSIPKRIVPVVIHAPSNRLFKRTDIIVSTLKELSEEGVQFRLRFIENMSNEKVLQELNNADVLIDQVACAITGRLALEGMSSGCAVVTGNSRAVPWPPNRPALSVTPATLKERLREVLTDYNLRLRLAAEGREYIEKGYHSPVGAAQAILDALEREKKQDFDHYPTAFTDFAVNPHEEPMPEFLQIMTLDILKRHGTHPDTDMIRLEKEGFIPQGGGTANIQRWNINEMHKLGPWNWCSKRISPPTFDTTTS